MSQTFYTGLKVYYRNQLGKIQFICDEYITVCINQGENKIHDVCLVVYPKYYEYVTLAKQSEK